MAFLNPRIPYTPSSSTSTPYASTTSPFSTSISAGIPKPPWEWWIQPGTSPWGKTGAQRLADSTFLISMNERMVRKHVEELVLRCSGGARCHWVRTSVLLTLTTLAPFSSRDLGTWESFVETTSSKRIRSPFVVCRAFSKQLFMVSSGYEMLWVPDWYRGFRWQEYIFQVSCRTLALTDRDPILVEKGLEYLYTADYTLVPGMLWHDTAITCWHPI